MCNTIALSTKGETAISSCMNCHVFYLWHNNLLLTFPTAAFTAFHEVVEALSFHQNCLPFPDDEDRVILHTPNDDICFAFRFEEFELFKEAMAEAIYMDNVYSLIMYKA